MGGVVRGGETQADDHQISFHLLPHSQIPFLPHKRVVFLVPPRRRQATELFMRNQARKSPDRHAADQRRAMAETIQSQRRQRNIARIADGEQDIAQEAGMTDALYWPSGKKGAKICLVHRGQIGKWRREEIGPRLQFRFARFFRKFVPGANREAIVATIDTIANLRRDIRAEPAPSPRWSDRKCRRAHRFCRARQAPLSGRRRDRRGRRRNDRCRPCRR